MKKTDITKNRLFNQRLTHQKFKTIDDAVNSLGAIQAQEYQGGLWSIGMRVENATELDVEKAVEDKLLIRTWPMRGTLHLVPAKDVKWMLKHLTPRITERLKNVHKKNGVDEKVLLKAKNLFAKALEGGKQFTRTEMYQVLNKNGIATKNMRGVLILSELAMEGLLCFGVHKGNQQTFTLLDEWITDSNEYEREEGLSILANRFFTSHGPATINDFAWWSGITIEDAIIALSGTKLPSEIIEGQTYVMPTTKEVKDVQSSHLLQAYDEYTIAYRNNTGLIIKSEYLKNYSIENGFTSSFIVNGEILGTWKKTIKTDNVVVHTKPFTKLDDTQAKLVKDSAEELGRFLNLPVVFI